MLLRFGPVEHLDRYLNRRILAAPASEVPRWWAIKVRAKRLLEQAQHPDSLAKRILLILIREERRARPLLTARAS